MTVRVLAFLGLLVVMFDCADLNVGGITILGAVFIALAAWLGGVFTRDFWISDDPRLAAIDIEISEHERAQRRY